MKLLWKEYGTKAYNSRYFLLCVSVLVVFLARLFLLPFLFPYSDEPKLALVTDHWGHIAWHVVKGDGYVFTHVDPNGVVSREPDVARGPVPVLWFAGLFALFGQSLWVVLLGNWLLDCGSAVVLWYLTRSFFPEKKWIAVLAVLMFAFYVPHIFFSYQAMSESIFTFLLMLHLYTLINLLDQPSFHRAAMAGLWLGLAALARPVLLPFPAIVFGFMLLRYRAFWQAVKYVSILGVVFVVVLMPWIIRNYLVFHAFIPGTSLLGYNLIKQNYYLNSPNYLRQLPELQIESEMERILNMRGDSLANYDQVGRNQFYTQVAKARILEYPGRYLVLSVHRFLYLWFYVDGVQKYNTASPVVAYATAAIHAVLLVMAVLSSISMRHSSVRQSILMVWSIILYFTVTHVPLHTQPRYIFPVMPLVFLMAAAFIYNQIFPKIFVGKDL